MRVFGASLKQTGVASLAVAVLLVPVVVHGILAAPRIAADGFWSTVALRGAIEVEHYDAIEEMAEAADAVLVGTIAGISEGRLTGGDGDWVRLAAVSIVVEEILRGSLPAKHERELTMEVVIPTGAAVGDLQGLVPKARHVFFLRNKGLEYMRLGHPADFVQQELPFYRLVTQRAILADVGGLVHAVGWTDHGDFLSAQEGRRFADLVKALRDG